MSVADGKLIITSIDSGEVIIKRDVNAFYLMTNDDPGRKSTDSKKKHFCARLMFCNSNGHLKLFFTTFDSMKAAMDRFL